MGKKTIAVDVKASKRWKKDFNSGLETLLGAKRGARCIGVYLGNEMLSYEGIEVFLVRDFLKALHDEEIF